MSSPAEACPAAELPSPMNILAQSVPPFRIGSRGSCWFSALLVFFLLHILLPGQNTVHTVLRENDCTLMRCGVDDRHTPSCGTSVSYIPVHTRNGAQLNRIHPGTFYLQSPHLGRHEPWLQLRYVDDVHSTHRGRRTITHRIIAFAISQRHPHTDSLMSSPGCCTIATMPDSIASALCCPLTPTWSLVTPQRTNQTGQQISRTLSWVFSSYIV